MAKTFTTRAQGATSLATVTSFATASLTPDAGGKLYALIAFRASDGADISGETFTCSGAGGTWGLLDSVAYDASTRMMAAVFEGTGPFENGALTFGTAAGTRTLDRQIHVVVQVTGDAGEITAVQSDARTANAVTTLAGVLAAFADPANAVLQFGCTDTASPTWTLDTTPSTHTLLTDTLTSRSRFAAYLDAEDTSPLLTVGGATELVSIALEIQEASAAGPTIDTDPVSGTACVAPAYPVTMTGAFTAGADPIQTVTWEKDGTPIADGGDYAITTNIGAGTTQLVITPSDDTDDGAEFTFVVDDEVASPAESAAATLTVKDGPTASATIGPTDSSGEASGSVTTDFVQPDGVFLRLPYTAGGLTQVTLVKAVAP